MKIDKFWVVALPQPESELGDVCFETDARGLALQFKGGTLRKLAEGYGIPLENLLKYAGYLEQPTDPKKEAEAETKVLFRDYEKLSEEKKKMFQMFLRSLQSQK